MKKHNDMEATKAFLTEVTQAKSHAPFLVEAADNVMESLFAGQRDALQADLDVFDRAKAASQRES